jgi:hypothetical protein
MDGLRITEVNYHPHDDPSGAHADDDFEFLEFQNIGSQQLDLTGVRVENGIDYTFGGTDPAEKVFLDPGEFIVIVKNRLAFEARYGIGIRVAGEFTSGKLDNGSEQIRVREPLGGLLQEFTYEDEDGWPTDADGRGKTLEIIDPLGNYKRSANWRASRELGGNPGRPGHLAGDATGDGVFDSTDLLAILTAAEYEDFASGNSNFAEGDFNGDGDFTTADLVFAFQRGAYRFDE